MDKKRKKKSLKHKAEHLKLELEDKLEQTKKIEKAFLDMLSKLEVEDIVNTSAEKQNSVEINAPVPDDAEHIPEDTDDVQENLQEDAEERPEIFKKLWKQIALLTHPDRAGDNLDRLDQYKRASEAWTKKNYAELISIAEDLGIEVPEDTELDLQVLEKFVSDLESQIKQNEESILWAWSNSDEVKKSKILDLYLRSKGKKRKS